MLFAGAYFGGGGLRQGIYGTKGPNTARWSVIDRRASPTMQGIGLWAAIFVLSLATFISILDTTIVNVAIPHIAGAFAASPNEGTWAITSYAVAEAFHRALVGMAGGLRFGVVRMFLFAIIGFTLCSALRRVWRHRCRCWSRSGCCRVWPAVR